MPRRRSINPNIWQSEDFSKLSMLAKLLFIGMFSMADDYGKGRGKPIYLKSTIFPYDDGMRLIDVEKALSEIGSNMSVTFYAHDGNDYYRLDNWNKWQTVDKPQPSNIPDPAENNCETDSKIFENDSGMIREPFENDSSLKEKKKKEEKIRETGAREPAPASDVFIPPTINQVAEYVSENGYDVDPKTFVDFFTASDWIDTKGNQVKNWKHKLITWSKKSKSAEISREPQSQVKKFKEVL